MSRMPPSFSSSVLARDVRHVEIHAQPVLLDAQSFVRADVENLARGDVARHQVAVLRIALFEEVVALGFGNLLRRARVVRLARHPHAAPFAAGAFAHQPQLVGAGNGRRMHLDELAVAVFGSGAEARGWRRCRCRPSTSSSGRRSARNRRRRRPRHRPGNVRISIVTRSWPTQPRQTPLSSRIGPEEVPELVLLDLAFDFPAAHLLVQA